MKHIFPILFRSLLFLTLVLGQNTGFPPAPVSFPGSFPPGVGPGQPPFNTGFPPAPAPSQFNFQPSAGQGPAIPFSSYGTSNQPINKFGPPPGIPPGNQNLMQNFNIPPNPFPNQNPNNNFQRFQSVSYASSPPQFGRPQMTGPPQFGRPQMNGPPQGYPNQQNSGKGFANQQFPNRFPPARANPLSFAPIVTPDGRIIFNPTLAQIVANIVAKRNAGQTPSSSLTPRGRPFNGSPNNFAPSAPANPQYGNNNAPSRFPLYPNRNVDPARRNFNYNPYPFNQAPSMNNNPALNTNQNNAGEMNANQGISEQSPQSGVTQSDIGAADYDVPKNIPNDYPNFHYPKGFFKDFLPEPGALNTPPEPTNEKSNDDTTSDKADYDIPGNIYPNFPFPKGFFKDFLPDSTGGQGRPDSATSQNIPYPEIPGTVSPETTPPSWKMVETTECAPPETSSPSETVQTTSSTPVEETSCEDSDSTEEAPEPTKETSCSTEAPITEGPEACGENEEWWICIPQWHNTCENFARARARTDFECISGCFCKDNWVKDKDGTCVDPEDCADAVCDENEEETDCSNPCNTCKAHLEPESCDAEAVGCYPGCDCKDGFMRDNNGTCIHVSQCVKYES